MKYLTEPKEMKRFDQDTIERIGIPSLVLMERAAMATAWEVMKRVDKPCNVLVVSGCGNNGGDGFVVGRILQEYGYLADYVLTGTVDKCTEETAKQVEIIKNLGNTIWENKTPEQLHREHYLGNYDVIIDAVFGIGLSRPVAGIHREWIVWMNEYKKLRQTMICSVDIPSGVHGAHGRVMGAAVCSDLTVTYGFAKIGQILYPGCTHCGELVVAHIGIPEDWESMPNVISLEKEDVQEMMPNRNPAGNKGSFGKVLVIAGSKNMSGACQFAATAAYRIGAGLVRILTPEVNRTILQSTIPEAILTTYEEEKGQEDIWKDALDWADCVLIGPGIGTSILAQQLTYFVLKNCDKPLVIDADGLNIIAGHPEWIKSADLKRPIIMTPHVGEFSRLTDKKVTEIKEDFLAEAKRYAAKHKVILACKDARTVIASPDGRIAINTSGSHAMATGGSGDVLSGMIAGLIAQKSKPYMAAVLGCFLHGLAGDMASQEKNSYAVMASDILDGIGMLTYGETLGGLSV